MRIIIGLLCMIFSACALTTVNRDGVEDAGTLSMQEIFFLLPQEAFYLSKKQSLISREELEKISRSKNDEYYSEVLKYSFIVDTSESSGNFLQLFAAGYEGTSAALKTWQRNDKTILVGAMVTVGDMCCDYSRIKFYHYRNASWIDVTDKVFPKLEVEDFVVEKELDQRVKTLLSSRNERNIWLYPDSDTIELSINHTPMLYSLYDYHGLGDKITPVEEPLKLVWKKNKFLRYRE